LRHVSSSRLCARPSVLSIMGCTGNPEVVWLGVRDGVGAADGVPLGVAVPVAVCERLGGDRDCEGVAEPDPVAEGVVLALPDALGVSVGLGDVVCEVLGPQLSFRAEMASAPKEPVGFTPQVAPPSPEASGATAMAEPLAGTW
jgi:hypothetical protein